MSERPLRKKIPSELEFIPNKGSYAARKIVLLNHTIVVELWFHKHYYERLHEGDVKGWREGIDPTIVESLVARSMEHLILYSAIVRGFNFVNYMANKKDAVRIVLQESMLGSTLNVVIEVHPLSFSKLEVTVITAMVRDRFNMASGQHCIKIQQERSLLKRLDNGQLFEIASLKFI